MNYLWLGIVFIGIGCGIFGGIIGTAIAERAYRKEKAPSAATDEAGS